MIMEVQHKKRKVEDGKVDVDDTTPKGVRICQFYITNKKRTCGMQRKKDQKYCSQHIILETESKRIPCPLDPSHTVWENDVARHMKKCNARPKEASEVWNNNNINYKLRTEQKEEQKEGEMVSEVIEDKGLSEDEVFEKYLSVVRGMEGDFDPLSFSIQSHQGLSARLSQVEHQKHPLQQSSLAGNLQAKGLLGTDTFYMEFGCGKAELSRFLNLCVLEDVKSGDKVIQSPYGFGLIDRSVNRMKNDPKIIKETKAFNKENNTDIVPRVKRTRIDIKDLNIDLFLNDISPTNVVAISKHLCGVATDLTLRSILNSEMVERKSFKGLVVAMCCRHVCDYDLLLPLSRDYLRQKGFKGKREFKVLKKLVSWAVSIDKSMGEREERKEQKEQKEEREEKQETEKEEESEESEESGTILSFDQRRKIGLIARRLIDESRVYALTKMLPDYKTEIFWYVKPEITLENVCLCITRRIN